MQRVAIYTRVSTQEQAENGNSLEFQIEKLKAYCEFNNYKIVGEYTDAGVSGAKRHRPALDRLINDIHKIDIVLIYKLDRLSRSTKDTMALIEDVFKPNNVTLISLQENFDTSQAIGMATIGMLSTFAQLERETIKERMVAGKVQAVKNGNYINKPPFGYIKENRRLIKDPRTRECVEFIFEKLLEGYSTTHIADLLEVNGLASVKSSLWHFATINKMARKRAYAGHTCLMKTLIPNTHEGYITDEEQERIIAMLEERNSSTAKTKYRSFPALFRGLLNCPTCHRHLATSRQNRKYGTTISYRCVYCERKNMLTYHLNQNKIDEALLKYFENFEFNFEFEKAKRKVKKIDYKKEFEKLENQRLKLQKAWLNELLTDEELKKHQNDIEKKIMLFKKEENSMIDEEKSALQNIKLKNIITTFSKIYSKLDDEEKVEFLNSFIESIDFEILVPEIKGSGYTKDILIKAVKFKS